jgi:hypothetical protein
MGRITANGSKDTKNRGKNHRGNGPKRFGSRPIIHGEVF